MIRSDLPITRLGPTDRPVVHSYYDICPESPDATRVLVTVFESDAVPGLARIGLASVDGPLVRIIGEPAEVNGHVGRYALWVDDDRIAFRHGPDSVIGDWSILGLSTGEEVRRDGAIRQWHAGVGRGLVQWPGGTTNPHGLKQGVRVVGDQGETIWDANVHDCLAVVPAGERRPDVDQLDLKNFKWSPDGSRFFVVFNNESYRNEVRGDVPQFKTIVSFSADGGDAKFLGHFGHHPTWAGDGTCIYAMNMRGKAQDLVAIPADGSRETRVVLADVAGGHGSFTPDGRYMIIDVPEAEHTECAIARFDLGTGERKDLARFPHTRWNHLDGHHPHPVISRDGRRVYFNAEADGRCGCYVMTL